MNKFHSSLILAALTAGLLIIHVGCAFSPVKNSNDDTASAHKRLTISWHFRSEIIDDEPHTHAWLVISGKMVQKEPAGRFYGGIMKSYSITECASDNFGKGILGGFMTYHSGTGFEVLARYDGTSHSITLLRRDVGEGAGKAPYHAIKTFTIRERGIIDSPPRGD